MEFTTINGIKASRVGLGTWAMGGWLWGGTDMNDSVKAVRAALEAGITLIDTAPVYGFGEAELLVGKALKEHGRRHEVVLSTKCGLNWAGGKGVVRDSRPTRLMEEIDDSLARLRTDYIDIYFVHWPDPLAPLQETAETLYSLLESGKIKAIGLSNFSPEQMDDFRKAAPVHACQPPYNIFERDIEKDIKPYCKDNGIALMTYGALCRGLLSGSMSRERTFEGDDLRRIDPKFKAPRFDQYLAAASRLKTLARERHGKDLLPFAVRWVLDQGTEIALWGARRPDQLAAVSAIPGWTIDAKTMADVDAILAETITDPGSLEYMAPPPRVVRPPKPRRESTYVPRQIMEKGEYE